MSPTTLVLSVANLRNHSEQVSIPVDVVVNAGYSGRQHDAVRAHVAELAAQGVRPPPEVPMYYRLPVSVLVQSERIEVTGDKTSGEVEYVLIVERGRLLVALGSDHTDRTVETADVLVSKQVCPNVCSTTAWLFDDVEAHWDEVVLRAWSRIPGGDWTLYQEGPCGRLLAPRALLDSVRAKGALDSSAQAVIFSGTIPACHGVAALGASFKGELFDPRLKRSLHFAYEVVQLPQPPLTPAAVVLDAGTAVGREDLQREQSWRFGFVVVALWLLSWTLAWLAPDVRLFSLPPILVAQTLIALIALSLAMLNATPAGGKSRSRS